MQLFRWLTLLAGTAAPWADLLAADGVTKAGASDGSSGWWQSAPRWLAAELFNVGGEPVTTIGLLRVVAIITVAWWISKLAQGGLVRIASYRSSFSEASLYTLNRLVHYAVLTVGFFVGLSSIGIDMSKFALFASALGVGVGFGLQNLIGNFVAGITLLFEKTLKVGDFIELESGVIGEVREINIRSTLITTNDNIDVVVPNSEFVNSRVMNWTLRDVNRRIRVPFGVAYGSDPELVRQAAMEAAQSVPHTLSQGNDDKRRSPQVWLTAFGDSSLNFELVVWLTSEAVKRPGAVIADYLWALQIALARHKLEIPFPQRDLHVRSWSPDARPPMAAEIRAPDARVTVNP